MTRQTLRAFKCRVGQHRWARDNDFSETCRDCQIVRLELSFGIVLRPAVPRALRQDERRFPQIGLFQ